VGDRRVSPLDREAAYLLTLAAEAPDLTPEEVRGRLATGGWGSAASGGFSIGTGSA
jgi:hypothetical protein